MAMHETAYRILKRGDDFFLGLYSKIYERHRVLTPIAAWWFTGYQGASDAINKEDITRFLNRIF